MTTRKHSARTIWLGGIFVALALAAGLALFAGRSSRAIPKSFEELDAAPRIFPDYVETTIPVNLAPTNFRIEEEGEAYLTRVSVPDGSEIRVAGRSAVFPEKAWRKALSAAADKSLEFEIFVKRDGAWKKYRSFPISVSSEKIDPWLAYRLIEPGYEFGHRICLAQRSLEGFREEVFADNRAASTSPCLNCHSFQDRKTKRFLFHFRQNGNEDIPGGTIVVDGKKISKVAAKFEGTGTSCTYPAWRPTGDLVAFSANQTRQFFHSLSPQKIEVYDAISDLVLYDVAKNEIAPIFNTLDDFETFPSWSPDGRSLYYCVAHVELKTPPTDMEKRAIEASGRIDEFRYNIMKIDFDETTKTFGEPQMVVDAASKGRTALFPRISPDGNWLLYTVAESGTFPIWRPEADLWIKDLRTGEERPIDAINSDNTESYHTWSSSGKWIVFSSRRVDGQYTRLYFSHIDESGRGTKPFSLPQKDPESDRFRFKSYNVPELIVEPIDVDERAVVDAFNAESLPTASR